MELDISRRRTIDVQRIFYKMEPPPPSALKFYCDEDMEDAHDALVDVKPPQPSSRGNWSGTGHRLSTKMAMPLFAYHQRCTGLHDFTNDMRFVDATQKMRYDTNGEIVFNFGKYNGQPVAATLSRDKQYYNWILNKEFSSQVKQVVKKAGQGI